MRFGLNGKFQQVEGASRADVIALLGALMILGAVFFPALGTTRQQDKSAVCINNLHQIWLGMMSLSADNDGYFYSRSDQNGSPEVPNGGQWTASPKSTNILTAGDSRAYWGVAYLDYVGKSREVFRCPAARTVDEGRQQGLNYPTEYWLTSTYGVTANHVISRASGNAVGRPLSSFDSPGTMILVQDAAESLMEGPGDTVALFPGTTSILSQWIGAGPPARGGASSLYNNYAFEWEWFRHDKRCNTIWLSGAVSHIPFKGYSVGIDYRYYTGDPAVAPVPQDW